MFLLSPNLTEYPTRIENKNSQLREFTITILRLVLVALHHDVYVLFVLASAKSDCCCERFSSALHASNIGLTLTVV
jgi:hypothetical protein